MPDRRVTVTISAEDRFSDVMRRYNTAVDSADTNTRQLGQGTEEAQGRFSGLTGALTGAVAAFGAMQVVNMGLQMRELGEEVAITQSTFTQLSGGAEAAAHTLQLMRDATGGVVSDLDLMQGANRLLAMNLAETGDEAARLTEIAVGLGGAMGEDAGSAIENFSLMLANQSIPRLDTFGISAGTVRARIDELIASGQAADREEAFRMAVMEEGARALDRLGPAIEASQTAVGKLETSWDNFWNGFALRVAQGVEGLASIVEYATTVPASVTEELARVKDVGDEVEEFFARRGASAGERFGETFVQNVLAIYESGMATDAEGIGAELFNIFGDQELVSDETIAEIQAILDMFVTIDEHSKAVRDNTAELPEIMRVRNERFLEYQALTSAERELAERERQADLAHFEVLMARQQEQNELRAAVALGEAKTSDLMSDAQTLLDTYADVRGIFSEEMRFMDPDEAEAIQTQASNLADQYERIQDAVADGVMEITPEDLESLGLAVTATTELAEQAQAAADAYQAISDVYDVFGAGAETPADRMLSGMTEDLIAHLREQGLPDEFADELIGAIESRTAQMTGEANIATIMYEQTVIPVLGEVAASFDSPAIGAAIATDMERLIVDSIDWGALTNASAEEIAELMTAALRQAGSAFGLTEEESPFFFLISGIEEIDMPDFSAAATDSTAIGEGWKDAERALIGTSGPLNDINQPVQEFLTASTQVAGAWQGVEAAASATHGWVTTMPTETVISVSFELADEIGIIPQPVIDRVARSIQSQTAGVGGVNPDTGEAYAGGGL